MDMLFDNNKVAAYKNYILIFEFENAVYVYEFELMMLLMYLNMDANTISES